jgi:hypothetical protein
MHCRLGSVGPGSRPETFARGAEATSQEFEIPVTPKLSAEIEKDFSRRINTSPRFISLCKRRSNFVCDLQL